ncbi:MAG TPA: hypothetical protein VGS27_29705 [Candidatus Sulfotelmatobacter sp.]|nr:hypothetical protein [Candidatus Sulfotelmatobacter sp.]
MFPTSAIQVLTKTSEQVEILDPPRYSAGAVVLLAGAIMLWFGLRSRGNGEAHWPYFVLGVPAVLLGLILFTGRDSISLSRITGTLTIQRSYVGVTFNPVSIPLSNVRNAVVESNGSDQHKIVLVLRSGNSVSIGKFSGQAGHYAAASAINDFLEVVDSTP